MNWTTFDEIICRQRDFSIHRYFDEIIILLQRNCFFTVWNSEFSKAFRTHETIIRRCDHLGENKRQYSLDCEN